MLYLFKKLLKKKKGIYDIFGYVYDMANSI